MPSLRSSLSFGAVPAAAALAVVSAAVTVGAVGATVALGRSAPSDRAAVWYSPPVDAPVVDPFRPPPDPYGPGNRGADYDTTAGEPVRAAAPGTVVFAGTVGHERHVVLVHADGLRTTYAFLSGIAVRRGAGVGRGQVIGSAGDLLHFGVRAGGAYLDPLVLLAAPYRAGPARLVPDEPPPAAGGELAPPPLPRSEPRGPPAGRR